MSTKRLQKTVIEGGRGNHNKWDRRRSNKEQRATERAYMSEVKKDPENFESDLLKERDHVSKDFTDKLGPMYNWLDAQVGRPWAEVRAEVFQKFDTRTTAGRHITFDHLLSSVNDTLSGWDSRGYIAANQSNYNLRWHSYYVNEAGILCTNVNRGKWKTSYTYLMPPEALEPISKWLNGRMIGEKGGRLYWFVNLEGIWKAGWGRIIEKSKYGARESGIDLRYYYLHNGPEEKLNPYTFYSIHDYDKRATIISYHKHWEPIANPAGYKQRGELTAAEAKYFKSLDKEMQADILAFGNKRFS